MTDTLDKKSQIFRQSKELRDNGATKEEIKQYLADNDYDDNAIDQTLKILGLRKEKTEFNFRLPLTLTIKGLLPFAITLFIVLALLTTQFLWKYSDDIFDKNLDALVIIQLIISGAGSLLLIALPYPVIIATVILYRRLLRENKQLLTAFRQDIAIAVSFSILVWIYAAFIQANVNLGFMPLLYDVRMKAPEKELERTDISLFKGTTVTENIFGIMTMNDSLSNRIQSSRETLMSFLKTHSPPAKLDSVLVKTDLSKTGLTANNIKTYNAEWDGYNYPIRSLTTRITVAEMEIENFKKIIHRNNREIWQMFFIPLSLLLLFVLGAQLGVINHKTSLSIILISLTFFAIPVWYYLTLYVDKLIKTGTISIATGKLGLLTILIISNFGLYLLTKKEMKTTAANN